MSGRRISRTVCLALLLAAAGCVPIYVDGAFQTLRLVFALDSTLPAGEETLVHSWFFPQDVNVRKNFVRVSGRLLSDGGELPGKVTIKAQFEQAETGKRGQRITLNAQVEADGSFSVRSKIKKNIVAGDLMMVTVEPAAAAIPEGAEVTVCVDVVRRKGDLAALPPCLESGGGEPATLTELQTSFFTPTCALSGCHNAATARAGLVLTQGMAFGSLVNQPSTQAPSLNRVTPNDPDNSYMIKKLRGDGDIVGERMPEGGPFLSDEQIGRFVSWINDGAPDN